MARRMTATSSSAPLPTRAYARPPGELAWPVPVHEAEGRHELDVVFGREVEGARRPDLLHLDVVLFALSDGDLGARNAGDTQHQIVEALLRLGELGLEPLEVDLDLLSLLDELRPVVLGGLGDQRGDLVLPRALGVDLDDGFAPDLVGLEELVEVDVAALVLDGGADDVGVRANEVDVEHVRAGNCRNPQRTARSGHARALSASVPTPRAMATGCPPPSRLSPPSRSSPPGATASPSAKWEVSGGPSSSGARRRETSCPWRSTLREDPRGAASSR